MTNCTEFFAGQPGPRGLTLFAIIATDDEAWESRHDFIQWLFPLETPSRHNLTAPVLTGGDRRALKGNAWSVIAYRRFLAFLGLRYAYGRVSVDRPERIESWLGTHNLLRITRVLTSMRLLGFQRESKALFDWLHRSVWYDVPAETRAIWQATQIKWSWLDRLLHLIGVER